MGRRKIEVSPKELLQTIQQLESEQTFPNISALAAAIQNTNWARSNGITGAIATLRINEFKLLGQIKTKPGKRGRQSGEKLSDDQIQKMQDGRSNKTIDKNWIQNLLNDVPKTDKNGKKTDRFVKIVKKIEQGQTRACIKLHCLQCSGYDSNEVRNCTVYACPIWGIRAYK